MKYLLKLRCTGCGNKYRKTVEVPEGKSLADIKDPPCPICAKVQKVIKRNWAAGEAPSIGGNNIMNKAIDETAKIVMEDGKLTDLHDTNLRQGDSMAPKLPPAQQAKVDSFWGGPKRGQHRANINTAALARNAMAGAYRGGTPNPVAVTHSQKIKPQIRIVAGDKN